MAIARYHARHRPSAVPTRYRGFPPSAVERIIGHFARAIERGDLMLEWSEGTGGEVVSLMGRDGLTWLALSEQDGWYSAVDGDSLVLAYGEDLAGVLRWLPAEPPGCERRPEPAEADDGAVELPPVVGWPS
jgi:hypothetical protein